MTVIERAQETGAATAGSPELLFPEANRRRRRRRLTIVLTVLVLLAGLVAVTLAVLPIGSSLPASTPPPLLPSLPQRTLAPTGSVPQVAWSDYEGQLHIGDLNGLSERRITQADADPTASLVALDGAVFWVRSSLPTPNQSVDPIPDPTVQRYDLAAGIVSTVGRGNQVFPSLDRSHVYVATGQGQLTEYTSRGLPTGHELQVPSGWFLADPSLLGNPDP